MPGRKMEDCTRGNYGPDSVGSIRFEFYLQYNSLKAEAWGNTRICRVSVFSQGIGRRIEARLSAEQWRELAGFFVDAGIRAWDRRYGMNGCSGNVLCWAVSIMTDDGWYYASGDGSYPKEFPALLERMRAFANSLDAAGSKPISDFLGDGGGTVTVLDV